MSLRPPAENENSPHPNPLPGGEGTRLPSPPGRGVGGEGALSIPERVADLVSRMTLAEKVSQMVYDAPAIERPASKRRRYSAGPIPRPQCLGAEHRPADQFALVNEQGHRVVEPGAYQLAVGGRQPTAEDMAGRGTSVVIGLVEISPTGQPPRPQRGGLWLKEGGKWNHSTSLPLGAMALS